jgi:1-acyl-sn-glycerol-3-phosphate acyltransferase
MAKSPVLGNDPFQRGAARRPEPEAAESAARPASAAEPPAGAKSPRRKAAPKPSAEAPAKAARRSRKVSKPAKPAAAAEPAKAAAKPARPERKPAKVARKPERASKPAARKPPAARKAPAAEPVERIQAIPTAAQELQAAEAAPQAESARPAAEAAAEPAIPVAAAAPAEKPSEPRPQVLEGEIVDELPPHRRTLALAQTVSDEPPASSKREHGIFARLRESAVGALLSAGTSLLVEKVPSASKVVAAGSSAMSFTEPLLQTARALLPAPTQVMASVANGQMMATAAAAKDALRAAARARPLPRSSRDPFGEDPGLVVRLEPIFGFLRERYFRVDVNGAERIPAGPCIVVCNHAGFLPIDGPMMRAILRDCAGRPDARWLVEESVTRMPFVGDWLNRLGAVQSSPESAERLLGEQRAVVVFPEGDLGTGKALTQRYKLQSFGRGRFAEVAIHTGVPIIPAAIVGAEESSPVLARLPVRSLGLSFPITPTFPWLGPLGLLPLPSKWMVSFLPPLELERPEEPDLPGMIGKVTEQVRSTIQAEVDQLLARREAERA